MTDNVRSVQHTDTAELGRVRDALHNQHFLSDVIQWLKSEGQQDSLVDVVVQDEFSHDVVVRYDNHYYLVYAVT